MMTSGERILTALRRKQPDRVPMTLRMWKFLRKHYQSDNPLENNLKAHDEFGIDLWHYVAQPPLPCFSPVGEPWRDDVAVKIKHLVRNDRNIWERTIHTPEGDLHDIKYALIISEGSGSGPEILEPLIKDLKRDIPLLRYMHADPAKIDVAEAQEAQRRIGEKGIAVASMYSPIDCRDVMTPADFMMLYHDDPAAFREIVALGAEAMMRETRHVLEAGFRAIQAWWFYCSPSYGWSPEIYENVFLPHLAEHVELVHSFGGIYVYYDDGRMRRFMDLYLSAGVDCLMTLSPPPLGDAVPEEVKSKYGGRVALMGGIDAVNEVWRSNPKSIRQMVSERLNVYQPGGGYIMDGSNSLVYETPAANVRALAEAGREFGGYNDH
ncbi:MAG: hypothetical protein HY646_18025 [Acidobacteria bacterium]|nr:hypothetical protein [Acidobacteriota bacterium]